MKSSAQVPNELKEPDAPFRNALSLTFLGLSFWLIMWIGNLFVGGLTSPKGRELQDAIYGGRGYFYFRLLISLVAFALIAAGTLKLVTRESVTKSRADTVRIVVVGGILVAIITANFLRTSPFYLALVISEMLTAVALFALFHFCTSIVDESKERPDLTMRRVVKCFFGISMVFALLELRHGLGAFFYPPVIGWLFALGSFAVYAYVYFKTLRALSHLSLHSDD